MTRHDTFSRRSFLALMAAAPLAAAAQASAHIPIGLELYSVRHDLEKDLMGTVRGVAKMGYECVEFFAPYYDWTADYAKQVRKELDALGIHCYSTHNSFKSFAPDGIGKATELNRILGARYVVLAHPRQRQQAGRLEAGCRDTEQGQRHPGGAGPARRLSQSRPRVEAGRRPEADRTACRQHRQEHHAAA